MAIEIVEQCIRSRLAAEVHKFDPPKVVELNHDRWVLLSLLQKAIRRDEPKWALAAASRLLAIDPGSLWRRLFVVGWEDVSFGNLPLLAELMAAHGVRWRRSVAGEWTFVAYFVSRLCASPKCRAPNNLIEVATRDPVSQKAFARLRERPFEAFLSETSRDRQTFPVRLLCALSLHGGWPDLHRHEEADAERLLEEVEAHLPACAEFLVRRGIRATLLEHPLALAVLWEALGNGISAVEDDMFMPSGTVRGIPAYAFDMHTRSGAAAIRRFCAEAQGLREVLTGLDLPPRTWFAVVRHCIFDLESGLVRRRLVDPVSLELRSAAETLGYGRTSKNAATIMDAIRSEWPLYSQLRSKCALAAGD